MWRGMGPLARDSPGRTPRPPEVQYCTEVLYGVHRRRYDSMVSTEVRSTCISTSTVCILQYLWSTAVQNMLHAKYCQQAEVIVICAEVRSYGAMELWSYGATELRFEVTESSLPLYGVLLCFCLSAVSGRRAKIPKYQYVSRSGKHVMLIALKYARHGRRYVKHADPGPCQIIHIGCGGRLGCSSDVRYYSTSTSTVQYCTARSAGDVSNSRDQQESSASELIVTWPRHRQYRRDRMDSSGVGERILLKVCERTSGQVHSTAEMSALVHQVISYAAVSQILTYPSLIKLSEQMLFTTFRPTRISTTKCAESRFKLPTVKTLWGGVIIFMAWCVAEQQMFHNYIS
jgi:hypothetical protein